VIAIAHRAALVGFLLAYSQFRVAGQAPGPCCARFVRVSSCLRTLRVCSALAASWSSGG
jgi:hypothetical protein